MAVHIEIVHSFCKQIVIILRLFTKLSLCPIRHLHESVLLFIEHYFHSQCIPIYTYKEKQYDVRYKYAVCNDQTHLIKTSLSYKTTSVHNQDTPLYHTIIYLYIKLSLVSNKGLFKRNRTCFKKSLKKILV